MSKIGPVEDALDGRMPWEWDVSWLDDFEWLDEADPVGWTQEIDRWWNDRAADDVAVLLCEQSESEASGVTVEQAEALCAKWRPGQWYKRDGRWFELPYLGDFATWWAIATCEGDMRSCEIPWPKVVATQCSEPRLRYDRAFGMAVVPVMAEIGMIEDPLLFGHPQGRMVENLHEAEEWMDDPWAELERVKSHPHVQWFDDCLHGRTGGSGPSSRGVEWGRLVAVEDVTRPYDRAMTHPASWETWASEMLRHPPTAPIVLNEDLGIIGWRGDWTHWRWLPIAYKPKASFSLPPWVTERRQEAA